MSGIPGVVVNPVTTTLISESTNISGCVNKPELLDNNSMSPTANSGMVPIVNGISTEVPDGNGTILKVDVEGLPGSSNTFVEKLTGCVTPTTFPLPPMLLYISKDGGVNGEGLATVASRSVIYLLDCTAPLESITICFVWISKDASVPAIERCIFIFFGSDLLSVQNKRSSTILIPVINLLSSKFSILSLLNSM